MAFRIGQRVVCVDDRVSSSDVPGDFSQELMDGLTKGSIYTIRGFVNYFAPSVYLEEIHREPSPGIDETPYSAARFRPIVEPDISIFTAMLTKPPKKVLTNEPAL